MFFFAVLGGLLRQRSLLGLSQGSGPLQGVLRTKPCVPEKASTLAKRRSRSKLGILRVGQLHVCLVQIPESSALPAQPLLHRFLQGRT